MSELLNNRYQLLEYIAGGYHGAVYKAEDTQTGKIVAIKKNGHKAEADILAKLDHPGIPKLLDYFEEGFTRYVVMEFIEGKPMADYDFKDKADALRVGDQLYTVLRYLKSKRVEHGDFHQHNVLVNDETVYVIDFVYAVVLDKPTHAMESERRTVANWISTKSRDDAIHKWWQDVTSDPKSTLAKMHLKLKKLAEVH